MCKDLESYYLEHMLPKLNTPKPSKQEMQKVSEFGKENLDPKDAVTLEKEA